MSPRLLGVVEVAKSDLARRMSRIVAHGSMALHNQCLPITLQLDTVAIVKDDTSGKALSAKVFGMLPYSGVIGGNSYHNNDLRATSPLRGPLPRADVLTRSHPIFSVFHDW